MADKQKYLTGGMSHRLGAIDIGTNSMRLVVVDALRDGSYETDGRAYLGLKRDARDIGLAPRPTGASSADQLSDLKTMRDKGLITEEEYQTKRRQVLDRM